MIVKSKNKIFVVISLLFFFLSCKYMDINNPVNISEAKEGVEDKTIKTAGSEPSATTQTADAKKKGNGTNCIFQKTSPTGNISTQGDQEFGRSGEGMWGSEKATSLTYLPRDKFGFYPDWVAAVEEGIIKPRGSINPDKPEEEEYAPDVLLKVKSPIRNDICFPHSVHTYWLKCDNCHPEIFVAKLDANPLSMTRIINGEFCGRCHGKVAFHVANNCHRCHNTPK